MNALNHQFRLAARPVGLPKRTDWNYTEEPARSPQDNEVLVKVMYLSLDPAMRAIQDRFIVLAKRDLAELRRVLRESAVESARALAAHVLGYAPD